MGVFQTISATDLAMQIKTDADEAIKLINNLGLHYTASRQRFLELLSLSQSDQDDKDGIIYYLTTYIGMGNDLIQRVQDDISGITDGSIFSIDPPEGTTPSGDSNTSVSNTTTSNTDTSNTSSANTP